MTTREVHEAKMIERAFKVAMGKSELSVQYRDDGEYRNFAAGYRAGYAEGLKWQDNARQRVAAQVREMLDAYQVGQRGLPTFAELIDVMRVIEGEPVPRTDADRMLAEDITAVKPYARLPSSIGAIDAAIDRARVISRLRAHVDDPAWPDHARVPKKLLEECISALVISLDGPL